MPPFTSILDTRDEYHLSRVNQEESASGGKSSNTKVWIISSIVGGILLLVTTLTTVIICYKKRRQYQKAKELNPYLSRQGFSRQRKMSAVDLYQEEEQQRQLMIRKSRVSRSTHSIEQQQQQQTESARPEENIDQVQREIAEIERQESLRLKDDWKRWEAKIKHERSTSGEHHPLESSGSNSGVPILAIPSPSKHRAQNRVSLVRPSPDGHMPTPMMSMPMAMPVPPPRHPDRPSTG